MTTGSRAFSVPYFCLVVVVALCSLSSGKKNGQRLLMVEAQSTPTDSQLPPGLQETEVSYEESRSTYVPFPAEAQELLDAELAALTTPLTVEVITTITHWQNPLWHLLRGVVHRMRAQNQIIYLLSYYHVGSGLQEGCRTAVLVDAATGEEEEMAVDTKACRELCTNHGRYCAPLPTSTTANNNNGDLLEQQSPKGMVEETLRRLCIGELYHDTDLRHWDYLDAFEGLRCHLQADMTVCAQQALSQVDSMNWDDVVACMEESGGLEEDTINVRLQEQVDRQQQEDYSLQDMPQVIIEGTSYEGPWDTENLLGTVCRAFPQGRMTPLACQFCEPCVDSRKCLWYLECDGMPFDVSQMVTSNIYIGGSTPSTAPDTFAPTAANSNATRGSVIDILAQSETETETAAPTSSISSTANIQQESEAPVLKQAEGEPSTQLAYFDDDEELDESDEEDLDTHGYFFGGLLAGLIAGGAPAICFFRDEKAIRKRIRKIQTERAAAGEEVDWESAIPQQQRYKDHDHDEVINDACGSDIDNSSNSLNDDNDDDIDDIHDSFEDFLDQSDRSEDIIIRPTVDELEALEDIDLADNQNNAYNSRPPRMSFKLHQFIS